MKIFSVGKDLALIRRFESSLWVLSSADTAERKYAKRNLAAAYVTPIRSAPFIKTGFSALWSWALWNTNPTSSVDARCCSCQNSVFLSRRRCCCCRGACFPPEESAGERAFSIILPFHSRWFLPPVRAGASWFPLLLRVQRSALWGENRNTFCQRIYSHVSSLGISAGVSRAGACMGLRESRDLSFQRQKRVYSTIQEDIHPFFCLFVILSSVRLYLLWYLYLENTSSHFFLIVRPKLLDLYVTDPNFSIFYQTIKKK